MTPRLLLIFLPFLFLPLATQAQIPDDPFFRMTFNKEKRTLVESFMDLSAEEAAAFWPVYNAYERERQAEGTIRLQLIERYLERFPDVTEQEAEELVEAVVRLQMDMANLKKKYFRKMKKALNARRAMSWLQLEEYLLLSIRMNIYDEIPFLSEGD